MSLAKKSGMGSNGRAAGLEAQSLVFASATGAAGTGVLALDGVKVAALDALERNMPALGLEAGVVAPIIIDPQAQENPGNEEAIGYRSGD